MKNLLSVCFVVLFVMTGSKLFAQEKYHLVRCDDLGMCHSVNMAFEKVIESGLPVSTSVMFACPWYQEAVDILRKHPEVSVGIHLTLNAEWKNYRWGPVTGIVGAPSLVDSCGYFFPSRTKLFANDPAVEEVELELRAQIGRAMQSGLRIDYLDYHMGAAVQTEELRQLVERLAAEYKLGIAQYFGEIYSNKTYHAPPGNKVDSLVAVIDRLGPGINLQVVHIGLDTEEMRAMKDLNPFGLSDMSVQRQAELESILSPEFRDALIRNDVISVTYRSVIDRIGLENMKRPTEIQ
jgi:predicted glycoside hydrolase/deacetylase ChbG (UPF0249 family)